MDALQVVQPRSHSVSAIEQAILRLFLVYNMKSSSMKCRARTQATVKKLMQRLETQQRETSKRKARVAEGTVAPAPTDVAESLNMNMLVG